ncbi:hypothetical protein [Calothrix sp. NIES-3974]|uniref:hypothetical protein n=1 Tax=Calothrix sp. NIES-3974 TaxID=2005462 RepID=UPI000B62339D|nr:hypothetical protein [Calothrix sp. NIES-3974]BAZ07518.1 hypothetical protein NIES3974_41820 [Calothrix sp. NIES-3974]
MADNRNDKLNSSDSQNPTFKRPVWFVTLSYLPALIIVLISILPSLVLLGKASEITSRIQTLETKLNQQGTNPSERKNNQPSTSGNAIAIENSEFAQAYIEKQVTIEVNRQLQQAAQDEINKAKGDLFAQITFPVLFAIASIFAAFAVKDILTEILKQEEKEKVKNDIQSQLEKQIGLEVEKDKSTTLKEKLEQQIRKLIGIGDEISVGHPDLKTVLQENIDQKTSGLEERTKNLENYIDCLEYQLLTIEMNQVIESSPDSRQIVRKMYSLKNHLLADMSKTGDSLKTIDLLQRGDAEILRLNANYDTSDNQTTPESTIITHFQESQQKWNILKRELFDIQVNLLLITLRKLLPKDDKDENNTIVKLIQDIEDFINRDVMQEYESGIQTAKRISSESVISRPSDG